MFNFGITIWHSIMVVDFGSRFWLSILEFISNLMVHFGGPFWYSIMALDFGNRILALYFGA